MNHLSAAGLAHLSDDDLTDRASAILLADMRLSTPETRKAVIQVHRACTDRNWVYHRARNQALKSLGRTPTALDLANAQPPTSAR